jgi:signal transduction histidine kinase
MSREYDTKRALIADDDVIQSIITEKLLKQLGYEVFCVNSGRQALEHIQSHSPTLAILAGKMPGMSGLELCQQIRDEHCLYTYIIMITGNSTVDEMEEAFAGGVDDFLPKPIEKVTFCSRIRAAERIIAHELELQVDKRFWKLHAGEMEKLAEERAKQLVHADRMVTLGTMSAGIAHEINNPTAFISGNAQMLEKFWKVIEPTLQSSWNDSSENAAQKQFILAETPKMIEAIKSGVTRISRIVTGLKSYSHQGKGGAPELCDPASIVESALQLTQTEVKNKVDVTKVISDNLCEVLVDPVQIEQVLVNLVINATHALEGKANPKIDVRVKKEQEFVIIEVMDNGPGLSNEVMEKLWVPFFTTKEVGKGTGLGLPICRKIIEQSGGKIEASNCEEGGAKFTIALPDAELMAQRE